MSTWIGADPGMSGGIACIRDGKAWAIKMPETDADLLCELTSIRRQDEQCFAIIEAVHSLPKQGVTSAFTFGMGYGALQMAFLATGIPFERVTPAKWQKALGCLTKGDKNVSKRKCQELFPSIKATHAIADSLLIAEYCKRTRTTP